MKRIQPLAVVLGLLVGIAPVAAQEKTTQEQIQELKVQLDQMAKQMQTILQLQTITRDLESIKARLSRLEELMDQGPQRSTSNFPPGETRVGTIKLENRTAFMSTITVNQVSYRLAPGETRFLNEQPVGAFSYKVDVDGFGTIRGATTRTLNAKETYAIIVYP